MKTIKQSAPELLNDYMMNFSAETLLNRAIPTLQDGLKPSQRHILFTMKKDNVTGLTKSARVAGNVMAVHPHGDSYQTMVKMAQSDKNQVPYLAGHGNWGKYTSSEIPAAASRYTEVKLSEFGIDMTHLVKQKVVDEYPNYDGTIMIPEVIPVTFPTILLYYLEGMGVGFSTKLLPYNMKEIAKSFSDLLLHDKKTPIYPDFPTGGTIIKDSDSIKNVFNNGRGGLSIRGTVNVVDDTTLQIVNVPYGVKTEQIIDKVVLLAKSGKFNEIKDIVDLTGFHGLNIEITTKKNIDMDILIAKLYQLTPLESKINANSNIIDIEKGSPEVMGVPEIMTRWYNWRNKVYRREIQQNIDKKTAENHLLEGLSSIIDDIDLAIKDIRFTKKKDVTKKLKKDFKIDDIQAEYILNMKLSNINVDYISSKIKDIAKSELELAELLKFYEDDDAIKLDIIKQVKDVAKKYGCPRQTEVISVVDKVDIQESLQSTKECSIYVTRDGYAFKEYGTSQAFKLKPLDKVDSVFKTQEFHSLNLICDDGNIYSIPIKDIDNNIKSIGNYLPSLSKYDMGNIIGSFVTDTSKVIYGYENGKMSAFKPDIKINQRITKNAFNKTQKLVLTSVTSDDIIVHIGKKQHTIKSKDIAIVNSRSAKGIYQAGTARSGVSYSIKKKKAQV